jgi:putative ABC transport system substrate-binding protein
LDRRRAISSLAIAASALVLAGLVRAQRPALRRVGFIGSGQTPIFFDAFRSGLADLGYVEGRNVLYHSRLGGGGSDELAQFADALVRERPDIIVAQGGPALREVRKVAGDLPVVFGYSGDPVMAGFAKSFAEPGANMTGISFMSLDLVGKRMELLKEAIPGLKSVAILANPEHPGEQNERRVSQSTANALKLEQTYFQAQSAAEVELAMAAIAKTSAEALIVFPDAVTIAHRKRISEDAIKARLPAVSGWAEFAQSGFLMSYGPNLRESYRRLAVFADKVLKGVSPARLPIELPSVVEMVVNASTAKALGIELPRSVLLRADRVIE